MSVSGPPCQGCAGQTAALAAGCPAPTGRVRRPEARVQSCVSRRHGVPDGLWLVTGGWENSGAPCRGAPPAEGLLAEQLQAVFEKWREHQTDDGLQLDEDVQRRSRCVFHRI